MRALDGDRAPIPGTHMDATDGRGPRRGNGRRRDGGVREPVPFSRLRRGGVGQPSLRQRGSGRRPTGCRRNPSHAWPAHATHRDVRCPPRVLAPPFRDYGPRHVQSRHVHSPEESDTGRETAAHRTCAPEHQGQPHARTSSSLVRTCHAGGRSPAGGSRVGWLLSRPGWRPVSTPAMKDKANHPSGCCVVTYLPPPQGRRQDV